jgi:hypothetical protein
MAYKVFSNGDALTGGELNTFLMNQSVISFATTAARDAALPSPLEGQLIWLEDTNKYVFYDGTTWLDLVDQFAGWSDKSANYTIVVADRGTTIRSTGSAMTVTVNNVLTQQGDRIDFIQAGAGQITFAAGAGVTLSSADSQLKTAKQFAAASIIFGGSGVYYLVGQLGA